MCYDESFERNLSKGGIQYHKETFPNGCIVIAGYNQLPKKREVYDIVKETLESRNDPTTIEACQNPNFVAAKSGVIKAFILFSTTKHSGSGERGLGELSESGIAQFKRTCKKEGIPFKYYPNEGGVDRNELTKWIQKILKPSFFVRLHRWMKKKFRF